MRRGVGRQRLVVSRSEMTRIAKRLARLPVAERRKIQGIGPRRAEIVVGARPIDKISHFSPIKKLLQYMGSWAVRIASNTNIPDAPKILLHNVYGWFRRVERGVYSLTDAGQMAVGAGQPGAPGRGHLLSSHPRRSLSSPPKLEDSDA